MLRTPVAISAGRSLSPHLKELSIPKKRCSHHGKNHPFQWCQWSAFWVNESSQEQKKHHITKRWSLFQSRSSHVWQVRYIYLHLPKKHQPHVGKFTHRRLRLPKVPQFRDWFGVSWFQCTFKLVPHSTFRVLNLGIGLGFHVCTAPWKAR